MTKSPQLLDTAAPLVILLVRLPHNVMASVSLCFPKREEGVGQRFLHYSAHSGVESWPQQKDSTQGKIQCKLQAISVDMDDLGYDDCGPLGPRGGEGTNHIVIY